MPDTPERIPPAPSSEDRLPPKTAAAQSSAQEHSDQLLAVSTALGGAVTTTQVAEVIIQAALPTFEATVGLIALLSDDGAQLECERIVGVPPSEAALWRAFPIEARLPLSDAVRERRLVALVSPEAHDAAYPDLVELRSGTASGVLLAVPLLIGDRCIGGMGLICPPERAEGDAQQTFLWTLAGQCALALERARLYDAERRSRADALTEVEERRHAEEALRQSEARLRLALEAGGLGTWHWELPMVIVDWSPETKALFGLPPETTMNRERLLGMLHPDDSQRADTAMRAAIDGGPDYDVEYRILWPDGSVHWLAARGRVQRDEQGIARSIEGVVQNIDARKRAEETLRANEVRFRALADNIAQLAWMADGTGAIFWYNQRWFDYTGTTLEEMQGWGWKAVHDPLYLDGIVEKFAEHVRTGRAWEDTFPLRGRDGLYRWFLSRASPIHDESGRVLLWCGTNTDITEQREALARSAASSRREAMLNQIGQAVLRSSDAEEIQALAVKALGGALEVDRCYFHFFDPSQGATWIGTDWHRAGLPSVTGKYPLSQVQPALLDDLFRHGASVRIDDVQASFLQPATVALLDRGRYRAVLATPFYSQGELTAVLVLSMADTPRSWTDDEVSLVEAVAAQTRVAVEAARVRRREHTIAEQLAQALQPETPSSVPGLELAEYYRPAWEDQGVGGDFSSVFSTDKGVTFLVVGDLAGKGLAAASQVATVRHMLRFALLNGQTVAGPIGALNRTLADHDLLTGFATLFVGRYDAQTHEFLYCNCGQDEGVLLRAETGHVETMPPTGPVLGAFSEANYTEASVTLEPGDLLALYTDGLTEAGPSRTALLTGDGVADLLKEQVGLRDARQVVSRLIAGVDAYAGDGVRDDQCLLVGVVRG